jgi:serine protease Do
MEGADMATLPSGVTAASLQLADALAGVAERLAQSTVQVRDPRELRDGRRGPSGAGSGVIWRADGVVVTNAHVVREARRVVVELTDGRAFDAEVTCVDPRRDLALLRLDALHLPAVHVGDPGALRAGQLVVALGHPWGVRNALAAGVVHATTARDRHWVKADVRLAPGNSGGPLADAWGRVVGINSMIVRGLAYAVPSDAVERFLAAAWRAAEPAAA